MPLGERHDYRVRLAGWLWHEGFDEDEIVETLEAFAKADGWDPPAGEIAEIAAWVATRPS